MRIGRVDGHRIEFTDAEYCVFMDLWNARGAYRTHDQLFQSVYSHANNPEMLIRAFVKRLREKLQVTDFRVNNTPWKGYWLGRLPEVIHVESIGKGAARAA